VLSDAVGENVNLDVGVLKSHVLLLEASALIHVGVYRFGTRLDSVIILGSETIVLTESAVALLKADSLASHMPNALDLSTVGKEPTILGLGEPPLRGIERVTVEVGIVGVDFLDVIPLHNIENVGAGGIERNLAELIVAESFTIERNLVCVIRGIHEYRLPIKNVFDDEREGFIDVALLVADNSAQIVDERLFRRIGSFHIENQESFALHLPPAFLSLF